MEHFPSNELPQLIRLASSLQCLSLDCNFYLLESEPMPEPIPTKLSLEVLAFGKNTTEYSDKILMYIFRHCSNVKHLKLHADFEDVIEEVFKTMV